MHGLKDSRLGRATCKKVSSVVSSLSGKLSDANSNLAKTYRAIFMLLFLIVILLALCLPPSTAPELKKPISDTAVISEGTIEAQGYKDYNEYEGEVALLIKRKETTNG